MKKLILYSMILTTGLLSSSLFSQNEKEVLALGLPGDNLNLYAVLALFQKSPTLEEFEKSLNDKGLNINNLDLNNDNKTDYISVLSSKEGNSYSIVLRVAINSSEYQDVAVIEVNKNSEGKVVVQIIGDVELYGKNYIIEPSSQVIAQTPNPGYTGNDKITINNYSSTTLNGDGLYYVNDWPIIAYLFSPGFSVYISPWRWGFYPSYWYPWTPIYFTNYWGFHHHYFDNHFYRRSPSIRYPQHYFDYSRRRNSSPTVAQYRRSGNYNATYSGRVFRRPEVISPRPSRSEPRARGGLAPIRSMAPPSRPASPIVRPSAPSRSVAPPSRTRPPMVRPPVAPARPVVPVNRQNPPPNRRN